MHYGGGEQITDLDATEDNEVHQVNMPNQERVARTLADPEYWNKKQPIKTTDAAMVTDFQRRASTCNDVGDGHAHYTLLREVQDQLRGTKLNIYFHTEY